MKKKYKEIRSIKCETETECLRALKDLTTRTSVKWRTGVSPMDFNPFDISDGPVTLRIDEIGTLTWD